MHTGCILLMVRIVPQSIDSGIVSSTDVRSQESPMISMFSTSFLPIFFKAVIEILLLRFLVSGFSET